VMMIVLFMPGVLFAQLEDKVADRLWESARVLDDIVKGPDSNVPQDVLKKANCVAVIPAVKKAALGFGKQYGRGAVACRKDSGNGSFGAPSMISLDGESFGFQIGEQSVDLVVLFMTPNSVASLVKDKVTLGSDPAAASGAAGHYASKETNATDHAEILTYAKIKGLFAGGSLKGSSLRLDNEANQSLYGRKVEAKQILVDNSVESPPNARKFLDALTRASAN